MDSLRRIFRGIFGSALVVALVILVAAFVCALADGVVALLHYNVYDKRGICQPPDPYSGCGTPGLLREIAWLDGLIGAFFLLVLVGVLVRTVTHPGRKARP